jgi:MoaA/NifB/PqqE/SkfB family radical SAM enzyme
VVLEADWTGGAMETAIQRALAELKRRNEELLGDEIRAGRSRLVARPTTVQIELTTRCNLQCTICARPHYDRQKNVARDIDPAILPRVGELLDTARLVVLGGYGEPTLHPRLDRVLRRIRAHGCSSALITNGTLLDERLAGVLIAGGLDTLIVSIDGGTEEQYRRIRGCSLAELLERLELLRSVKEERKAARPRLEINFVANRSTAPGLADLIRQVAARGAEAVHVVHQKLYDPSQEEESLFHDLELAERAFAAARRAAEETGIALRLPFLGPEPIHCRQPFEQLFVRHNGEVLGCCSAVFANDAYRLLVGDIREQGVEELWNAPVMVAYREAAHGRGPFPRACVQCAFRIPGIESHRRYRLKEEG